MAHAVTLQLPVSLYDHFKSRAKRTRRSLQAELLEAVATVATEEESLPRDMEQAIADLQVLDDEALWRAARAGLSEEARTRLEELNLKQQREGFTPSEREEHAHLLHQYDRAILVRAHAMQLLKERGHDVSQLLTRR